MTIRTGDELPELIKHPTTRQLVQYAGAQSDFYEIHYDSDFARSVGFPDVIVQGLLKAAFLGQLVTDWLGENGILKTLEVSYRGIDSPGTYRCRGSVVGREGAELEIQIWGESPDGTRTAVGHVSVQMIA